VAGQVDLTWTDGSKNETGFEIQRFDPGASAWTTLPTVTSPNSQSSGLQQGSTYRFRVRAVNGAGHSTWSETVLAIPAFALPNAPSSLVVEKKTSSLIHLHWSDSSSNESGFTVQSSTDGGTTYTDIGSVPANVTSYDAEGLASASYRFRVRAFNASGSSSPSGATAAIAIDSGIPGTPDNSFGTGGLVTEDFGNNWNENACAVKVLPDGKTLALGYAYTGTYQHRHLFLIFARYNKDGTADSSFGGGSGFVAVDHDLTDPTPDTVTTSDGAAFAFQGDDIIVAYTKIVSSSALSCTPKMSPVDDIESRPGKGRDEETIY
jgi:hypothetical protein